MAARIVDEHKSHSRDVCGKCGVDSGAGARCSCASAVEKYLSCADARLACDAEIMASQVMQVALCGTVMRLVARGEGVASIATALVPLLYSKFEALPWLRIKIGVARLQNPGLLFGVASALAAMGKSEATGKSAAMEMFKQEVPFQALVHTSLFVGHWMIEYNIEYAAAGGKVGSWALIL